MKDAEELMKEASDLLEEKIPFSEKYLPKEWGLLKTMSKIVQRNSSIINQAKSHDFTNYYRTIKKR